MSKKSSKTSHVLNLITNRIGAPEDGETEELQDVPMFLESDAELIVRTEANMDDSTPNPTFKTAATTITEEFPSREEAEFSELFSSETAPASAYKPEATAAPFAYSPPQAPVAQVISDPVADRIRQELEDHLEASISPMMLQDFSDPRHQRRVELPITRAPQESQEELYATDIDEYVYANIMEELVIMEYQNLMRRIGVCDCKRCRNDIIAISLNKLPPKYVVTKKGYLMTKLATYNMQYHTDVVSTITGACLRVKKYPNHNEDFNKKQ